MGCKELKASVYLQGLIDADMINIFHARHLIDAMHIMLHKYGAYSQFCFHKLFF